MDGGRLCISGRLERSKDTRAGAYSRQWTASYRLCPVVFQNIPDLDRQFVRHTTEVKNIRHMHKTLQTDISSGSNVAELSCCCWSCPFSMFYRIREVNRCRLALDLEAQQRSKELVG